MAELADALDLGSSEATRTGSIPASRTTGFTNFDTICVEVFIFLFSLNDDHSHVKMA